MVVLGKQFGKFTFVFFTLEYLTNTLNNTNSTPVQKKWPDNFLLPLIVYILSDHAIVLQRMP